MRAWIKYFLIYQNPYVNKAYQEYLLLYKDRHMKSKKHTFKKLIKWNIKYRMVKNVKIKGIFKQPQVIEKQELLKRLDAYQFISFDVFDTLILRAVRRPEDIFLLIEQRYHFVYFKVLRMRAEIAARERFCNNEEITICDIYDILYEWTNLDRELWIDRELSMEIEMSVKNDYIYDIYQKLRKKNKKLLAISDMYLSKDIIQELLRINGYFDFEIYVSSEYNKSKASGSLFDEVRNQQGLDKWIHIGDNQHSDFKMPRRKGLEAVYIPNIYEENRYSGIEMSEYSSALYYGILQTHLGYQSEQHDPYYKYGFVNGGFLTCGYCSYINLLCKTNNINKILFVARDGYIIQKVYQKYYSKFDNHYIAFSRFVSEQILFEKNAEEFIDHVIRPRVFSGDNLTLETMLNEIDMGILIQYLDTDGLTPDTIVSTDVYNQLIQFVFDHKAIIIEEFANTQKAAYAYLCEIIGESRSVLIVDVGWFGTGGIAIQYLLEEKYQTGIDVYSTLIGTRDHYSIDILMAGNKVNAYVFSGTYNKKELLWHNDSFAKIHDMLVEILFTAPQPGFLKFVWEENEVKLMYAEEECENYSIVNEIHRGILKFAEIYNQLNPNSDTVIAGTDAYIPIVQTINNSSYCYELFKEYTINQLTGIFGKKRKTKLGDIMKRDHYI